MSKKSKLHTISKELKILVIMTIIIDEHPRYSAIMVGSIKGPLFSQKFRSLQTNILPVEVFKGPICDPQPHPPPPIFHPKSGDFYICRRL